ncbi:MAG: hypothetical protein Q8N51_09570 [Gammaproteobacteria bacterium]|nr:hypothetical protein [Gammaproteobacteria bacterium]
MSAHARPYTASTPDSVHLNIAANLRGMIAYVPREATDGDLIELWQCAADLRDWELVDAIDEMVEAGQTWADVMDVLGFSPASVIRH